MKYRPVVAINETKKYRILYEILLWIYLKTPVIY